MPNILFITGDFLPSPSSNGICIQTIAEYLVDSGHAVFLLTISDDLAGQCKTYNGATVYYVAGEKSHISIVSKLISYCEAGRTVDSLHTQAIAIIDKHHIEKIVCVYRPVETILCGMKLRKAFPECKTINYFMDIPTDVQPANAIKKAIYLFNARRFLRKSLSNANATIAFESYYAEFLLIIKKKYFEKILFAGMPKLKAPTWRSVLKSSRGLTEIVYAGRLYPRFREPDFALDFLKDIVLAEGNIVLHFYSWGCEENLEKYKPVYGDKLILHGKVDPVAALDAINSADIILNISNDLPNQVASKVMEYFSTGKPVLNVRFRKDDPGNPVYNKYPLIFNINKYSDDNSSKDCLEFIKKYKNTSLPFFDMQQYYRTHTPEYTANLILNH